MGVERGKGNIAVGRFRRALPVDSEGFGVFKDGNIIPVGKEFAGVTFIGSVLVTHANGEVFGEEVFPIHELQDPIEYDKEIGRAASRVRAQAREKLQNSASLIASKRAEPEQLPPGVVRLSSYRRRGRVRSTPSAS